MASGSDRGRFMEMKRSVALELCFGKGGKETGLRGAIFLKSQTRMKGLPLNILLYNKVYFKVAPCNR